MRWLHSRRAWLALLFAATTVAGLLRGSMEDDPETARIAALVRQLGDDRFALRQDASLKLAALGEVALPELRAAAASGDLEVVRRAQQATRAILLKVAKSSTLVSMVPIEAGQFDMGSPNAEAGRHSDETQHAVRLTASFLLGTYEVTQDEFQRVMKSNPSWFQASNGGHTRVVGHDTGKFPVERVTWYDAIEFCNLLSQREGLAPYYTLGEVQREAGAIKSAKVTGTGSNGYRLPTEAEWEFACRAGMSMRYHFGNVTKAGLLNCKPLRNVAGYGAATYKWQDLERTTKVGSYPANGLGLYDMHGNVAEWCWDAYDKDYYQRSPRDDPKGPDASHRVLRGGAWLLFEDNCRSATRFFQAPDDRKFFAGFRVARTPGTRR